MAGQKVRPLDLQRTAASIAANYGDKGALVISYGDEGIRIGTEGLSAEEIRESLCAAIHYSYVFEGADQ